jgi:hypothetical protein
MASILKRLAMKTGSQAGEPIPNETATGSTSEPPINSNEIPSSNKSPASRESRSSGSLITLTPDARTMSAKAPWRPAETVDCTDSQRL